MCNMSDKTKNNKITSDRIAEVAQQAGLVLMTAAFTFGLVEMPENHNQKVVVPNQPAFAVAHSGGESHPSNDMHRERQEAGPHYTSYSVAQRTPARAGRA